MTVVLQTGAVFEFAQDASFSAYNWDTAGTGYSVVHVPAPAGTQFTITVASWDPPGSDVFPATQVETNLPLPERDRFGRSISTAVLAVDQSVFRYGIARSVRPG